MTSPINPEEPSVQSEEPHFTDSERNAMRTYLQRSEVRLSTYNRIGLAFISGAGLLLLVPVFFKDAIDTIIEIMLREFGNFYPQYGNTGFVITAILYLLILYPLLLSLVTPLYALYLVLKDVVQFYFTIYMPGSFFDLLNPTLALSGTTFWADESPEVKRQVMRYQYRPHKMDYMLPFSEDRNRVYFDKMIENTGGFIIPKTRTLDKLRAMDAIPPEANEIDVQRFNAAMGLARSLDRTLVEDVAVTEMAMVRHILYLRRMLLRYAKTLLVFIWTTTISFVMLPFLKDGRLPTMLILSIGYLTWSAIAIPIMRTPLRWLYRHRHGNQHPEHVDVQLTMLEDGLMTYIRIAVMTSFAALVLALYAHL